MCFYLSYTLRDTLYKMLNAIGSTHDTPTVGTPLLVMQLEYEVAILTTTQRHFREQDDECQVLGE